MIQVNIIVVISALCMMAIVCSAVISMYIEKKISKELYMDANRFIKMQVAGFRQTQLNEEYFHSLTGQKQRGYGRNLKSNVLLFEKDELGTYTHIIYQTATKKIEESSLLDIQNQIIKGKQIFTSIINGEKNFVVSIPVQISKGKKLIDGVMITYTSTSEVDHLNRIIFLIMLAMTLLIGSISTFVVYKLSKQITIPIKKLTDIAQSVAKREFEQIDVLQTGDEIEVLSLAMKNMSKEIAEYDQNQKEFLQNVSHELKTPLMSIVGYAEGIKDGVIETKEDGLDIIIEQGMKMKKIVEDIIYLSRLEDSTNQSVQKQEIEINTLIIQAIKVIESIAIKKDIDIYFLPIKEISIKVDKEQIIRVLINILSNCLKYTKDRIEIKIEVEEIESTPFIIINIKDNGDGFSDEALEKVFYRFYKGEREGTGLGMCIAQKIIQQHQGKLTIFNDKQEGAVFNIYLPLGN